MSTDTKVANLIINKGLTKAELNEKYQQGLIGDNELSIVDTEENVVQVDEMPVASASNVNSIVQFSGETTEDYTNGYFYKCILSDGVYSWTQINVQPGGGGAGIEWKTIVDLPATYSSGTYGDCPQFIVQGGLPDGNYEFYYQVKTQSNSGDQTAPFGVATYKIICRFYHDNEWPYMVGSIAPVVEGNWMPSSGYKITNRTVYGCFFEDSGNFIMWGADFPIVSDLGDWPNTFVPGCFKLSAIKNTDTGDEYIATGIEPDGQHHSYTKTYSGSLYMDTIQLEQSIPSYFQQTTLNYGTWYMFSGNYITINETSPGCCSELDVSLVSSNGGRWHIIAENTPDSYKINLLEASGDLVNVQIGYNESNNIVLYVNTPSGTVGTVNTFVGIKGAAQISAYFSDIGQPASFTQFTLNAVGRSISTSNYGSILQYTGATDSNYTNGYFYKANGTPVISPASMLCNETSGLGLTITCNDIEGFITALASNIGWNRTNVQSVFKNQVTVWQYTQDSNTLNWDWYGNVNPSLISYFDIVGPEVPASTTIQWTVSNYVAEETVITNPSWDRVDVQPAADPLPSQTGQSGKFLTTDGTTASWSDKPLQNYTTANTSVQIASTTPITISTGSYSTAVGNNSYVKSANGIAIGLGSYINTNSSGSIVIGNSSYSSSGDRGAIIIGGGGANTQGSGTFSVSLSTTGYVGDWHTYKIVDSDGTIPTARLTKVNTTITLTAAGWSNGSQTVSVSGITSTGVVFVSPDPTDQADYTSAGILCTAQAAGTLTFTCDTVPSGDIDVNVVCL